MVVQFKVNKARKLARRLKFQGMDISIETDKGQLRHWYDPHNKEDGTTKMRYPYGYIRRTMGADDEHVDCYVGPEEDVDEVYVIHQMKAPNFKRYDEDKVMLGFESPKHAKNAYLMHYNKDGFFGSMDTMSVADFREQFVSKALPPNGPMGAQAEPPPSVDDPEGVNRLLARVYSMSDNELENLVGQIWGSGYEYQYVDPDDIRDEILGFLLDQRDQMAIVMQATPPEQLPQEPSQSPDTSTSSPTSTYGPGSEEDQSAEESYSAAESAPQPWTDSSEKESSTKYA